MASKKKLKKQLGLAEHRADEMFASAAARANELRVVDEFLQKLELPGPTIREYAYQCRDALLYVAELRGLTGINKASVRPPDVMPPATRSEPDADGDGTYTLPTEAEVFNKQVHVPAGTGRFA